MSNRSRSKVDASALASSIQTILSPKLFKEVEALCVQAIASSGNHDAVRRRIGGVIFQMRMLSMAAFGHETIDTYMLSQLLERTNPDYKPPMASDAPTRKDPITEMENRHQLDADQLSAAMIFREMWTAWGRFLQITSRNYEGQGDGGNRSKALNPIDVMSQDVYEKWQNIFVPWARASKERAVPRRRFGKVLPEHILFEVIVKGNFPDEVDRQLNLVPGSAKKCLKQELKLMLDPDCIARAEAKEAALTAEEQRRGIPLDAAAA